MITVKSMSFFGKLFFNPKSNTFYIFFIPSEEIIFIPQPDNIKFTNHTLLAPAQLGFSQENNVSFEFSPGWILISLLAGF